MSDRSLGNLLGSTWFYWFSCEGYINPISRKLFPVTFTSTCNHLIKQERNYKLIHHATLIVKYKASSTTRKLDITFTHTKPENLCNFDTG